MRSDVQTDLQAVGDAPRAVEKEGCGLALAMFADSPFEDFQPVIEMLGNKIETLVGDMGLPAIASRFQGYRRPEVDQR